MLDALKDCMDRVKKLKGELESYGDNKILRIVTPESFRSIVKVIVKPRLCENAPRGSEVILHSNRAIYRPLDWHMERVTLYYIVAFVKPAGKSLAHRNVHRHPA